MMFKRVLFLISFLFFAVFIFSNSEFQNVQINSPAALLSPKAIENDIISQKNDSFSYANIISRNTHLKNHHNTNATSGAFGSHDAHLFDFCLEQILKKDVNNKSLAQKFLLIQKLSNAPPIA